MTAQGADAERRQTPDRPAEDVAEGGRRRRRPWTLILSVAIIALAVAAALLAPILTQHDPTSGQLMDALLPPAWLEGGQAEHLLGTDRQGRDVFARILFGLRVSLLVAFLGLVLLGLISIPLSVISGYFGGWVDAIIQRSFEVTMAIPGILVALALALALGPSMTNVLIIVLISQSGRIVIPLRADALALRERGFVRLAKSANAGPFYIIRKHIFPHVRDTSVVLLTLVIGQIVLLEAALSFLGVGIPPPTPSLGAVISEGLPYLSRGWWISVFPGIVLTLIVLSANMAGDWLRDYWDPKLRR